MFRSRVELTGGGLGTGVSTMYWGAADDATGIAAVRNALNNFWTSTKAFMHSSVGLTFDGVLDVVDEATGAITGVRSATSFALTGALASEPLPWSNQALVQWRTGAYVPSVSGVPRTREVRGRTFVPGVCEVSNVTGVPEASFRTTLEGYAATLVSNGPAAAGVYSEANHTLYPITASSVWARWAMLGTRRS